jgi:hypothetical protein
MCYDFFFAVLGMEARVLNRLHKYSVPELYPSSCVANVNNVPLVHILSFTNKKICKKWGEHS